MPIIRQRTAFGPGVYRGHKFTKERLMRFVEGSNKALEAGVPIPLLEMHAPINADDKATVDFAQQKGAGWVKKFDLSPEGHLEWEAEVPASVKERVDSGELKMTSPEFRDHYASEKQGVYEGPIVRHMAFTPLPGNPHQGAIETVALSELGCFQFSELDYEGPIVMAEEKYFKAPNDSFQEGHKVKINYGEHTGKTGRYLASPSDDYGIVVVGKKRLGYYHHSDLLLHKDHLPSQHQEENQPLQVTEFYKWNKAATEAGCVVVTNRVQGSKQFHEALRSEESIDERMKKYEDNDPDTMEQVKAEMDADNAIARKDKKHSEQYAEYPQPHHKLIYKVMTDNGPDVDFFSSHFKRLANKAHKEGATKNEDTAYKWLTKQGMFGSKSDKLRGSGDKYYPSQHTEHPQPLQFTEFYKWKKTAEDNGCVVVSQRLQGSKQFHEALKGNEVVGNYDFDKGTLALAENASAKIAQPKAPKVDNPEVPNVEADESALTKETKVKKSLTAKPKQFGEDTDPEDDDDFDDDSELYEDDEDSSGAVENSTPNDEAAESDQEETYPDHEQPEPMANGQGLSIDESTLTDEDVNNGNSALEAFVNKKEPEFATNDEHWGKAKEHAFDPNNKYQNKWGVAAAAYKQLSDGAKQTPADDDIQYAEQFDELDGQMHPTSVGARRGLFHELVAKFGGLVFGKGKRGWRKDPKLQGKFSVPAHRRQEFHAAARAAGFKLGEHYHMGNQSQHAEEARTWKTPKGYIKEVQIADPLARDYPNKKKTGYAAFANGKFVGHHGSLEGAFNVGLGHSVEEAKKLSQEGSQHSETVQFTEYHNKLLKAGWRRTRNSDASEKAGYGAHYTHPKFPKHLISVYGKGWEHSIGNAFQDGSQGVVGLPEYLTKLHNSQHSEETFRDRVGKQLPNDTRLQRAEFIRQHSKGYTHGQYVGADDKDTNLFHDLVGILGGSSDSHGGFAVPQERLDAFHKHAKASGYVSGKHYTMDSQHAENEQEENELDNMDESPETAILPPVELLPPNNPDMPPAVMDPQKLQAVLAGLARKNVVLPSTFNFQDPAALDILLAALNSGIKAEDEAEAEQAMQANPESPPPTVAAMPYSEQFGEHNYASVLKKHGYRLTHSGKKKTQGYDVDKGVKVYSHPRTEHEVLLSQHGSKGNPHWTHWGPYESELGPEELGNGRNAVTLHQHLTKIHGSQHSEQFSEEELAALPPKARQALEAANKARIEAEAKAAQFAEERQQAINNAAKEGAITAIRSANIAPALKKELLSKYDTVQFSEGNDQPVYTAAEVAALIERCTPPVMKLQLEEVKPAETPKANAVRGTRNGQNIMTNPSSEQFFEADALPGHMTAEQAEAIVAKSPVMKSFGSFSPIPTIGQMVQEANNKHPNNVMRN